MSLPGTPAPEQAEPRRPGVWREQLVDPGMAERAETEVGRAGVGTGAGRGGQGRLGERMGTAV